MIRSMSSVDSVCLSPELHWSHSWFFVVQNRNRTQLIFQLVEGCPPLQLELNYRVQSIVNLHHPSRLQEPEFLLQLKSQHKVSWEHWDFVCITISLLSVINNFDNAWMNLRIFSPPKPRLDSGPRLSAWDLYNEEISLDTSHTASCTSTTLPILKTKTGYTPREVCGTKRKHRYIYWQPPRQSQPQAATEKTHL